MWWAVSRESGAYLAVAALVDGDARQCGLNMLAASTPRLAVTFVADRLEAHCERKRTERAGGRFQSDPGPYFAADRFGAVQRRLEEIKIFLYVGLGGKTRFFCRRNDVMNVISAAALLGTALLCWVEAGMPGRAGHLITDHGVLQMSCGLQLRIQVVCRRRRHRRFSVLPNLSRLSMMSHSHLAPTKLNEGADDGPGSPTAPIVDSCRGTSQERP